MITCKIIEPTLTVQEFSLLRCWIFCTSFIHNAGTCTCMNGALQERFFILSGIKGIFKAIVLEIVMPHGILNTKASSFV